MARTSKLRTRHAGAWRSRARHFRVGNSYKLRLERVFANVTGMFAKSLFLASLLCLVTLDAANAPSGEALKGIAAQYLARQPIPLQEKGFSMEEALRTQDALVHLLTPKLGPVAGYKVGLITKPNQERMGANGPVHGALLKKMLWPNNSKISAHYGNRPASELDMGVYVKDAGINNVTTAEEAAQHLSTLVCFIELVDTITLTNQTMDAALLTALNVGARGGIIGEKRKMTPELAAALPNLKMTMLDENGKVIAEVPKLNLQPLANIPWLVAELKKEGKSLKKGDFLSLGSPAATQPVMAGQTLRLRYENIPGGPLTAAVTFTP